MTISRPRPDILIKSSEDEPIAAIEVKNRQNLSKDVATELRQNLLEFGLRSQAPYFLLLSQDVGYLWKDADRQSPLAPPNYEFPMDKVVSRYREDFSGERLYGAVLELLVYQWLTDLIYGYQKENEEPERILALSGFNEAIKGSRVSLQ